MTLNLCNESQSFLILEASAFLTQMIIITDVVNVFFEHHDQDTIFLDAAISSLESNICIFFKNIASFTFVIFTELALTLLDQTFYDNKEKSQLNSIKSLAQHQMIIINIMTSLIQSFSDFTSVSLKNLLKIHYHAALNENIKSICVDVERKERQCILLQTRMKVVEHEFLFITFNEIQSIIDDVKILQKQQNYLKMCAWREMLFIKNITLLKDLNQTSCILNFDYFLTWWSRASDYLKSKFCKRVIAKVIKSSFINDNFSKKRTIIFKIISLNKFLKEKKFKFIINKNLKLFLRKLKLNFIKMNYIKDNDKLDYIMKYIKITAMHYLQQIKKTVEKKDCRITWVKFLKTLQQCLLDAKSLQNWMNDLWNVIIKRSNQTCMLFFLKLNKTYFQNHVKVMKFEKVLLFRFLNELLFLNKIKLIILTFAQWSKMFCQELMKYIDMQHALNYALQN